METRSSLELAWARQWQQAAPALAERRLQELQAMSEEAALAASENLLSLAEGLALGEARLRWSGLVEQQALFGRHRLS